MSEIVIVEAVRSPVGRRGVAEPDAVAVESAAVRDLAQDRDVGAGLAAHVLELNRHELRVVVQPDEVRRIVENVRVADWAAVRPVVFDRRPLTVRQRVRRRAG